MLWYTTIIKIWTWSIIEISLFGRNITQKASDLQNVFSNRKQNSSLWEKRQAFLNWFTKLEILDMEAWKLLLNIPSAFSVLKCYETEKLLQMIFSPGDVLTRGR